MVTNGSGNDAITARPRTGAYTVPGLTPEQGAQVAELLQDRLNALNDLALTLKHVHWNVVGPHFIAVHEMIDPQVDEIRGFVDETAERIATLGSSPLGTPGEIVKNRSWNDYSLERATTNEHLGALNVVYEGIIADHRKAQAATADVDPVTEDMLISQIRGMELFQWFVRAHLQNVQGDLSTAGAAEETAAARQAGQAADS